MSRRVVLALCAGLAAVLMCLLAVLSFVWAIPEPDAVTLRDGDLPPRAHAEEKATELVELEELVEEPADPSAGSKATEDEHRTDAVGRATAGTPAVDAAAAASWLRALLPEKFAGLTPEMAAQLQELDLRSAKLVDADLALLQGLPNLRVLSLRGTPVSDAGLVHLAELGELRQLDLRSTSVTGQGVRQIRSSALEALHLTHTQVTEADLATLPRLPGLKTLKLNGLAMGDGAVDLLFRYPALQHVELDGTKITDEGLRRLVASNPNLQRIELRDTPVTPAVVQELAAAHPQVSFAYSDGLSAAFGGR